jgi:hypothetical protein
MTAMQRDTTVSGGPATGFAASGIAVISSAVDTAVMGTEVPQ